MDSPAAPVPGAFRVLVVCHANQCRSPMAERLLSLGLRRRFGHDAEGWSVESAGLRALPGREMDPHARQVLREWGATTRGFASRELTADLVAPADLILTAERRHRASVIEMVPGATARTFTLRQFGSLAAQVPPINGTPLVAAGPELLSAALAQRGRVLTSAADEDLEDPVGRSVRLFRRCARTIDGSVDQILAAMIPQHLAT